MKPAAIHRPLAQKSCLTFGGAASSAEKDMQTFIVIQQHAWSNDHGFSIGYSSDLEKLDKREMAISHGFEVAGCDDFNIGVIAHGRLTSLDWMEKPVGNGKGVSAEKLHTISETIGLEAS